MAAILAPKPWIWTVIALAALALISAWIMQYGFGLYPCNLCIYQRYPYGLIVILCGLLAWRGWLAPALAAALILLLIEAGVAYYHWGVELGLIPLPQACLGVDLADDFEAFKASILADKPRCDEVAFSLFGLSIAAMNALFASLLAGLTGVVLRRQIQAN